MGILLNDARMIRVEERDPELELALDEWPRGIVSPPSWTAQPSAGLLRRRIEADPKDEYAARKFATELKERVLRFPSAPIHGLHRLSQDHVNMGPVEAFHSYRLLSHPESSGKVSRIFLLHNGLNEIGKVGLYYQLASFLINQDKNTVCILRPFPGHLTRGALPGLSETPLDHYLWDGLHLFRQFLRYMIETRWMLSAIVRCSYYHCVSGSGLLGQSKDAGRSRLQPNRLARKMSAEWKHLYEASKEAIDHQATHLPCLTSKPPVKTFEQAIISLQKALGLGEYPQSNGASFDPNLDPELHVIGYSLGGFAAQSVFMSWPFLISSCSTLLSGGAMRELAPTAFADPEEWQTVLHSLRYELDDAMMDWRFQQMEENRVAGIDPYLFRFLKRTFYEVFQQEYRGSFQTRLVSFRQRMLFIVGGNDPIVRPQSVLDSSPPDGINLLSIGGLGHFLEGRPQTQSEKEQRLFWMPEIGRTIGCLASEAAVKHNKDLANTWLNEEDLLPESYTPEDDKERRYGRLSVAERLAVERDGTLPSLLFQRSLDDLLARVCSDEESEDEGEGLLFILKNEPPTFLLDERTLQQHASALYHEDVGIVDHIYDVRLRRPKLEAARPRVCVVLPWNVETVIREIDAGLQHPSQSESSGEQMDGVRTNKTWPKLQAQCKKWTLGYENSIRVFDGNNGVDGVEGAPQEIANLTAAARRRLEIADEKRPIKPALPDCWVWMSNEFLGQAKKNTPSIDDSRRLLCKEVPKFVGMDSAPIAEGLRKDDLRMVTVSRARYNPRFRGRIIAEPRQAQELLLQVALCIAVSTPFGTYDFKKVSPPDGGDDD